MKPIVAKALSYDEARNEHFTLLMKRAKRKLDYWKARIDRSRPNDMMDEAYIKASDAGWEYNFYKDAIEALKRYTKWISVEDRLPETDECVLFVDDGAVGYRIVRGWALRNLIKAQDIHRVTHWMPLPELPKEVEHEPD